MAFFGYAKTPEGKKGENGEEKAGVVVVDLYLNSVKNLQLY